MESIISYILGIGGISVCGVLLIWLFPKILKPIFETFVQPTIKTSIEETVKSEFNKELEKYKDKIKKEYKDYEDKIESYEKVRESLYDLNEAMNKVWNDIHNLADFYEQFRKTKKIVYTTALYIDEVSILCNHTFKVVEDFYLKKMRILKSVYSESDCANKLSEEEYEDFKKENKKSKETFETFFMEIDKLIKEEKNAMCY